MINDRTDSPKNSEFSSAVSESIAHSRKRFRSVLPQHLLDMIYPDRESLRVSSVYRNLTIIAAALSAAIAALALFGWAFDLPNLTTVVPGWASMKPNTAVSFILLAAAMVLLRSRGERAKNAVIIGSAVAFVPLFIGLFTLASYALGVSSGIDQILFSEQVRAEGIRWVGRMSPITAANFTLLGTALILLAFRGKYAAIASQILVLPALLFSLISLAGYVYDVEALYVIPLTTTISLNTAVAFAIASIGTVLACSREGIARLFLSETLGGLLLRRLVPFAAIYPFLIVILRMKGQDYGFYTREFGLAISTTINIFAVVGLIWWTARSLNTIDLDRKSSRDSLRRSIKDLADVKYALDQSSIVAFTDKRGKITYVNDKFCEISGYSREELLGQDHRIINSGHHSKEFFADLWETISSGKVWEDDIKNRTKDGNFYWVNTTIIPFIGDDRKPYQYVAIRHDITLRKNAEEKLRSEKLFSDFTINGLPGVFYLIENGQNFIRWNERFETVSQYSGDEIAKMQPLDFFAEDEKEMVRERIAEVFEKGESSVEANFLSKDGTKTPHYFTGKYVDYNGRNCLIGMGIDISEIARAKAELLRSEERYRDLFDNNPFPMMAYDTETLGILAINDAAVLTYGYSREEFLKMTMLDVRPENETQKFLENLKRPHGTINKFGVWNHKKKTGEVFQVEITSHSLKIDGRPARLVLANDVTEQRRAEAALRNSEARYRELFDNNPLPMWVYDLESLRFLAVNDAALQQYGYSMEEFLGLNILQIRPNTDLDSLLQNLAAPAQRLERSGSWTHVRKDGTELQVEISSHELEFEGRNARLVLSNDVTDRERAAEEIKKLNETLEQRVKDRTVELEAVNDELESFAYSVSHDLRAPLRAIDGFSKALLDDCAEMLNQQGIGYIERVRSASQNMAELIEDLLNLSRMTRREMNRREVDLAQIAAEVVRQLREGEPERNVRFECELELTCSCDRGLLRVVLENLIGNAWKFTSKVEDPEISFTRTEENGESWFVIKDNGAGFDMRYADKLFGAFQRLHSKNEFQGTGIGLATVQRIINRHGGSVRAEGKVGEGAKFYFKL